MGLDHVTGTRGTPLPRSSTRGARLVETERYSGCGPGRQARRRATQCYQPAEKAGGSAARKSRRAPPEGSAAAPAAGSVARLGLRRSRGPPPPPVVVEVVPGPAAERSRSAGSALTASPDLRTQTHTIRLRGLRERQGEWLPRPASASWSAAASRSCSSVSERRLHSYPHLHAIGLSGAGSVARPARARPLVNVL